MDESQQQSRLTPEQEQKLIEKRHRFHEHLGELSLDHGIVTIIINPHRQIATNADGLEYHEILGALEYTRIKIEFAIRSMLMINTRQSTPEPDASSNQIM